jgi:hypothetical protein
MDSDNARAKGPYEIQVHEGTYGVRSMVDIYGHDSKAMESALHVLAVQEAYDYNGGTAPRDAKIHALKQFWHSNEWRGPNGKYKIFTFDDMIES